MKIISCVGAKGGTGKSSIALILAWELARVGKVAIIDADIQGTCLSAKKMNDWLPFEVKQALTKSVLWETGKHLTLLKYDYLIIDGNPRSIHEDPELIKVIATLSDLNLIVTRPSPRDIKAQLLYVDMVKSTSKGEIRLLWNFFQKRTGAHVEGIPEGEKLLGLKSIKTRIGARIVYQDIGYSEKNIRDLGNLEAAFECTDLGREIRRILNEKT